MTSMTTQTSSSPADADTWTVAAAKAHFSAVLERARGCGPQLITRHGRPAAVVVAPEEWARKTRRSGNLADFFAASPLREAPDLDVERSRELPSDASL